MADHVLDFLFPRSTRGGIAAVVVFVAVVILAVGGCVACVASAYKPSDPALAVPSGGHVIYYNPTNYVRIVDLGSACVTEKWVMDKWTFDSATACKEVPQ